MTFTPKNWINRDPGNPLDASGLIDLEQRLAAYTDSRTAGLPQLLPSGRDDTAAISAANVIGQQLGSGTFLISGVVIGCPRGQGSEGTAATIIQCTNAAARIQHGAVIGQAPPHLGGTYGGFYLHGENLAGSNTVPLFTSNVVGAAYQDIIVAFGAGDGIGVYGQNCAFTQCNTTGHAHIGMVLDQGAGGHVFIRFEYGGSAGANMEIRQTSAYGLGYNVPSYNFWYGCIFESYVPSMSLHANVHHINGSGNVFDNCVFSAGGACWYEFLIEQTGLAYGFPNFNGQVYFRQCTFQGGTVSSIRSGTAPLYTPTAVILQGDNLFGSVVPAIDWHSITPIRQDGMAYNFTAPLYHAADNAAGTLLQGLADTAYVNQQVRYAVPFQPADLVTMPFMTFDNALAGSQWTPALGFIFLAKFYVPQSTATIGNLNAYVSTAGVGLTAGQCFGGIYDSSGNLWAKTADQATGWQTSGLKVMSLTPQGGFSLTLTGGLGTFYWAAILVNAGTSAPKFASSPGSYISPSVRPVYAATIPGALHRFGYEGAGARTSLLTSLNGLAVSDVGLTTIPWVGVN